MKISSHLKLLLSFWKSSVSRKMTLYFIIFGIVIFYATSALYLIAFRQSIVTTLNHLINSQFKQMENQNTNDFIWKSVNHFRPDMFNFLKAFVNVSPELYSINDISIYCLVASESKWYRLYFGKDQTIHAEPANETYLLNLNRSLNMPLVLSNFHFFITQEKLSLFYNITGKNDLNHYFLKVNLNRQGIGGILKKVGVNVFAIWIILLFLTRVLAYIFARKFARPIEILSQKTAEVAQGNLKTITGPTSNDEIGTLARNFNSMIEGLKERDFIKETFGKYVTKEIRDKILKGNISLNGELKRVTVLFADLRNFTPLVESTPPDEVARIINNYFEEMSCAIHNCEGLVIQFIGDEIEAVFGAPLPIDNHPSQAVLAALEMRRRLDLVNKDLETKGYPALQHGVGIHTGQVLAANIGSPDRLSYALIGDTVNLASRIQELNKDYGTDILISHTTQSELIGDFALEKVKETSIRGKSEPVELYKVL